MAEKHSSSNAIGILDQKPRQKSRGDGSEAIGFDSVKNDCLEDIKENNEILGHDETISPRQDEVYE